MSTPKPPPDLRNATFDFSQFHPTGDHWPFTAYCEDLPGGWRTHLRYAWVFHRWPQVRNILLRPLCWIGRHDWLTGFRRVGPKDAWEFEPFDFCERCGERKP